MLVELDGQKRSMPSDSIIGNKWGKLVAISEKIFIRKGKKTDPYVNFQCDCGSPPKLIRFYNVTRSLTQSCGCLRSYLSSERYKILGKINGLKNRKYDPVESIARDLYSKYMKRHSGDLDFENFYFLTQKDCFYCGKKPSQEYLDYSKSQKINNIKFIYNGLDRMDNNLPYNVNNVVTCCGRCNIMKMDMTYEDFIQHIRSIYLKLNMS